MSITIYYITKNSYNLAKRLAGLFPDAVTEKFSSHKIAAAWNSSKILIFIMATGIVVRTIAPLIKDKKKDPAVVVLDEKGRYAISLLSGHLGGANKVAKEIADFLDGRAVITTASDINEMISIDLWAKEKDLIIENWDTLPKISTRFLNNGKLNVYSDVDIKLPDDFQKIDNPDLADVLITNKIFNIQNPASNILLYLRPKNLVIGIGCNSGTSAEEIEGSVKRVLDEHNLSFLSVKSIATIDIKGNEQGLLQFAAKYNLPLVAFTADELNSAISHKLSAISFSEAAFKATGAYAVAEPAALLASENDELLVAKQKIGNVTIAVAELVAPIFQHSITPILYIVGTGPGSIEHITPYAQNAIRRSDIIVGYGTYLELIKDLIKDKKVVSTGMTQEIDRCKKAVELALSGKTVSVISGGDPGIYAMAGLVFEILKDRNVLSVMRNEIKGSNASRIAVRVIPGISALNACAARLGAPLMHDFAVISLSDRLTSWELIEKRLTAAAMSDFVTVLYNPKSMGRPDHINKARAIFLRHRSAETPVGIVKSAMRENENVIITNLRDMLNYNIDMQTTVIIGNSQTIIWNNLMITPRGYEKKFNE